MRPATAWRKWVQKQVLAIGPSRLALGLAILLVLVSLALPFWSLSQAFGTEQDIRSFSWTTQTTDRYVGGAWDGTTILPYTSTQFRYRAIAGTVGTAYLLDVVLLVILGVVLALFSTDVGRTMPTLSFLTVSLIALAVGLIALFYPVVAIPGAATIDVGAFTIDRFWGSTSTPSPATAWSWGPGLGWWVLLAAVVLGTVGAVLPYLRSVRAMVPPAPKDWRPSS